MSSPTNLAEHCLKCKLPFNPWSRPPHFTPMMVTLDKTHVCVINPMCEDCWKMATYNEKLNICQAMLYDWEECGFPITYKMTWPDTPGFGVYNSWNLIIRACRMDENGTSILEAD